MFGFNFSLPIYNMVKGTPWDSMNLDYNLYNSTLSRNSIMYMTPSFQGAAFMDYPMFGQYGDSLINPWFAIGQTMQAFKNNTWMNNGWMNNGCMNNNWMNNSNPFNNNGTNNNSNPTTAADKVKQKEYDTLSKLLKTYKEISKDNNGKSQLSTSMEAKIDEALEKSGTIDEKLAAIKGALKLVPAEGLRKAVLSDGEIKAKLADCGYNLSDKKLNKDDDAKLRTLLESAKQELSETPAKYDILTSQVCKENDEDILRTISYWNDKYENIINMIADKMNTKKDEGVPQSTAVNKLTKSLMAKADKIQEHYSGDFTKLKAAQKEVSNALGKVNGENGFTKANLEDLAKKFDKLYAMLRLLEAEALRASIKSDYQKLLKDATGKDIIPSDFIIAETKADLKKEGITSIPDIDKIEGNEGAEDVVVTDIDSKYDTPEEKIEALKGEEGSKAIKDSPVSGVYMTNAASKTEKPHFYFIDGDDILELKDVVNIDEKGQCTMKDGTKKTLAEAKKATVKAVAADIMQYAATLSRIEELTKAGGNKRLEVRSIKLGGNDTLYRSLGKNKNGYYQRFVVRDNKLMRIICDSIDGKGNIYIDGSKKTYAELTDSDFEEISDSDILKTDAKDGANNGNGADIETETGDMYDLADKLNLTTTGMIGYYRNGNKYYKYDEDSQKMIYQEGVTKVYNDGTIQKDGKRVPAREVETPETAGKVLYDKLRQDTSKADYVVIKRKMNSFKTYTEAEDIVNFIESYLDQRTGLVINTKLCAEFVTENDLDETQKKGYLRTIAQKVLKVAQKAGMSNDSEEITRLKEFINTGDIDTHWYSSWSDFWTTCPGGGLLSAARRLDVIIDKVLDNYRNKFPDSGSGDIAS